MERNALFYAFALNGDIYTPVKSYIPWESKAEENIFSRTDSLGRISTKHLMTHLKWLRDKANASRKESDHYILMFFLRASLRAFPKDVTFWHFAGKLAEERGHHKEALALFERGLSFDSSNEYLLMSAAQSAYHLHFDHKALNYITRLIDQRPDDKEAIGLATQIALASNNIPQARAHAQRQLELDHTNTVALGLAGQVEHAAGNFAAARKYIEAELAIDKNSLPALGTAAQLELKAGNIPAARHYIERCLALDEKDPSILSTATHIELEDGDIKTAEKYAGRNLAYNKGTSIAHSMAAQVALAVNDIQEARKYIQRALDIQGTHPGVLCIATQIELAARDLEGAQKYSERNLAYNPKSRTALGMATQVALITDNISIARLYAERQLTLNEYNPIALSLATQVELAAGNIPAAQAYARRNLNCADKNPIAIALAVRVELEAGDFSKALLMLESLPLSERRKNKILTYFEAKAHLLNGDTSSTLKLVTPLLSNNADRAFTTLFMACKRTADEVRFLEPLLGTTAFDLLWEHSRDLFNKRGATNIEKAFFYGHGFWGSLPAPTIPANKETAMQMGHKVERFEHP